MRRALHGRRPGGAGGCRNRGLRRGLSDAGSYPELHGPSAGRGEGGGKGSPCGDLRQPRLHLTAERVALNLLQRMCGIATLTRRYVDEIAGMRAKILDTRKTAPGLRILDKYAVRAGGGCNHRFALYDGVLIKDNHIAAAGGIAEAVRRVRGRVPHTFLIEVEVKNMAELEEALVAGADSILLDNMGLSEMAAAVTRVGGKIPLEASGNITLERVRRSRPRVSI